jgi:hypothetical protein
MATMTEIPISEEDVNVIEERKSVELSGRKFNDLLLYLTHLEDQLSTVKFDLESEHRFANLLLHTFVRSVYAVSSEASEGGVGQAVVELFSEFERGLERQVQEGFLSAEQLQRFYEVRGEVEGTSNVTY